MRYNATLTDQRRAIIARYGVEGLGLYWAIIAEYEQQGHGVATETLDFLAKIYDVPLVTIHAVAFDLGAFRVEGGKVYPLDEDTDAESKAKATERARKGAAKRWEARAAERAKRERRKARAAEPVEIVEVEEIDPSSPFGMFTQWLQEKCPYISNPRNLQQITAAEFDKLKAKYSSETIAKTLLNIENRKDLRKTYVNLYRTLLNWLKNETNKSTTRPNNATVAADNAHKDWVADLQTLAGNCR